MAAPLTPPNDGLKNIDSAKSNSPVQGGGVYAASMSRDADFIFVGHVNDVYPPDGTVYVSLNNQSKNLPCVMAGSVMSGFFGVRQVGLPSIGSHVVVYVVAHGACGYVLGVIPALDTDSRKRPVTMLTPNCGVNTFSINEVWNPADWEAMDVLPAGANQSADVLPGELAYVNEFGAALGVLRLAGLLKGSDLSKVEAFAIDNLLRITGHNLETFTAAGELLTSGYYGRVGTEEYVAFNQHESLGMAEPGAIGEDNAVDLRNAPALSSSLKIMNPRQRGLWRLLRHGGWTGDMVQEYIVRPSADPMPESPDSDPPQDAGMLHEYRSRFGRHFVRSLAGGGIHKVDRIPVPIRRRAPGEPGCDEDITETPIKDFDLVGGAAGPAGANCKAGDYFAYMFGKQAQARLALLKKDFYMPEEKDVELVGGPTTPPSLGGFFREFPEMVDLATGGSNLVDDSGDSSKAAPGRAWIDILPNGGISIRDIWGCGIETGGGKVTVFASNGIDFVSGGSVVATAGDDFVVRAKNSVDLTATDKQVRIKGEKGVFMHGETGGLQFSTGDNAWEKQLSGKSGEEYVSPGIIFKTKAPLTIDAVSAHMFLESDLYVTGNTVDSYPEIIFRATNVLTDLSSGGSAIFRGPEKDLVAINSGMVALSKGIYSGGSAYFDGDIFTEGYVSYVGGSGKVSKPTPKHQSFTDGYAKMTEKDALDAFEQPLAVDDLPDIRFTYRSTDEYGAADGKWFQAQWQQDLDSELQSWTEKKIEETYPYPGRDHYDGGKSFYTYEPINFNAKTGEPVKRDALSEKGGQLVGQSMNNFKVIPN